jgi:hypothetical protein
MVVKKIWALVWALFFSSALTAAAPLPDTAVMLVVLASKADALIQANIDEIATGMQSVPAAVIVPSGARDSSQTDRDALAQEVAYQKTVAAIFDDVNDSVSRGAMAAEKINSMRATLPLFEQFMKKNTVKEFSNDRSKTRYKIFAYMLLASVISNKSLFIRALGQVYNDPFFQPIHRTIVAEEFTRVLHAGLTLDDGQHVDLKAYLFGKRALALNGLAVLFDQLFYATGQDNESVKTVMGKYVPYFWSLRRLPYKAYDMACRMLASGVPQAITAATVVTTLSILVAALIHQPDNSSYDYPHHIRYH